MTAMTREQSLECAAFLKELRRTANAKLSAELAGVPMHRLRTRRRRFPDFAQDWDAALAFARAALANAQAKRGAAAFTAPAGAAGDGELIARGGELAVRAGGRRGPQVRRARAGDLTGEGVRAFLAHLAATANVTLSAQAAGVTKVAIYNRARRSPVFEQEMREALRQGFDRVELALLESANRSLAPDGADLTDWLRDSTAIEPLARMSVDQALLVLLAHRRTMALDVPRRSAQRKPVSSDAVTASIIHKLDLLAKRAARDGES